MIKPKMSANIILLLISYLIIGCSQGGTDKQRFGESVQDTIDRVGIIEEGLKGPEPVQYDPDQNLNFISSFNGNGTAEDSNGFITRANIDGEIDPLKYMTGTEAYPLHAPRRMYLTGDTLFVADQFGVHGFNRYSGKQIHFTDFFLFRSWF